MNLAELADSARGHVRGGRRAIVGVTGPPGAGKTTFVALLLDLLRTTPPTGLPVDDWVAHVPMDGFHLADVELDRLGRRHRKGAPDTFDTSGYLSTLRRIKEDVPGIVYAPGFERTLEQPIAASIPVPTVARLIITEGNYLLVPDGAWPRIRALMDEVWYVDLDEDVRTRRLIDRHVEFGKDVDEATAWVHGPDQANAALVVSTKHLADLVIGPSQLVTRPADA
jgi:pantothenate kinase